MDKLPLDAIPFPEDWYGPDECYILDMPGDSMVELGIEERDKLVIKKEATPYNGRLVAVKIGNQLLIRKYMQEGNMIKLLAGNNKYEPIRLREEDVYLLGVVTGVMKMIG